MLADTGFGKKSHLYQWALTLIFAAVMLRITAFMHVLGQYFILKVMDCPVEEFNIRPAFSELVYGFYYIW